MFYEAETHPSSHLNSSLFFVLPNSTCTKILFVIYSNPKYI